MNSVKSRFPAWLRVKSSAESRKHVTDVLSDLQLNTVCANAQCPNLGQCFSSGVATFLIMGDTCTRNCRFCAIAHGARPAPPKADEPERLAEAVRRLELEFVVITSVTRDDLPDGGADCFYRTIQAVKRVCPGTGIEVLTPDFKGSEAALRHVLSAKPNVFNHNVETVPRLFAQIRSEATYARSLAVLGSAVRIGGGIPVKSGIMLGLGEHDDEVVTTLRDLRAVGVSLLTIGQYLPPSPAHQPLMEYITPEAFDAWRVCGENLGFSGVMSSPLVRSSYHARELLDGMTG